MWQVKVYSRKWKCWVIKASSFFKTLGNSAHVFKRESIKSINWEVEELRSSSVHSLQRIVVLRLVLRLKWSASVSRFSFLASLQRIVVVKPNAKLVLRLKWSASVSRFRLQFRCGLCRLFVLILWRQNRVALDSCYPQITRTTCDCKWCWISM